VPDVTNRQRAIYETEISNISGIPHRSTSPLAAISCPLRHRSSRLPFFYLADIRRRHVRETTYKTSRGYRHARSNGSSQLYSPLSHYSAIRAISWFDIYAIQTSKGILQERNEIFIEHCSLVIVILSRENILF